LHRPCKQQLSSQKGPSITGKFYL